MEGHRREGRVIGGEADGERPERGMAERAAQGGIADALSRGAGCGVARAGRLAIAQQQRMHRQGDGGIAEGERDERVAPAELIDEELRQRDEHRAGEAADQGQRGDACAVVVGEGAGDHGEDRLVERRRQRQAEAEPDHIEERDTVDARPGGEQYRGGERAQRHHRAAAMAVDAGADRIGRQSGGEQSQRQRAVERSAAPAELAFHRHDEQREAVIDRAPRDELRRRERPDQRPAARHRRR